MQDLMKLAMMATEKNVTTKKSKKSINDHLFEMLFDEGREMDRMSIIVEISFKRYEEEISIIDEEIGSNLGSDPEWARINKTVKNGLDTAVCSGKTASSFCSNPQYQDYELVKNGQKFTIVKK